MQQPTPLGGYPAATLDALHAAITALLRGYQDMLPTDLSVKLEIFRYDISQAIDRGHRQVPYPAAPARPLPGGPGPGHPQRGPDQARPPRASPHPERHPR